MESSAFWAPADARREDRDGEEEYDNDGGLELVEDGARSRGDRGKQAERHKAKQVGLASSGQGNALDGRD